MTYNVFSGTLNHTHLHLLTGLGQGDIVLDGDPAPPTEKDTAAPHFSAHIYCGKTVAHLGNC